MLSASLVSSDPSELRRSHFSGRVWFDSILIADPDKVSVGVVFFEPASRTDWHAHTAGQLLFVSYGSGLVVTRDGQHRMLECGDVVYAPPGEEHWHGAAPGKSLMHTSVALGETEWLEAVSDDAYQTDVSHFSFSRCRPVDAL